MEFSDDLGDVFGATDPYAPPVPSGGRGRGDRSHTAAAGVVPMEAPEDESTIVEIFDIRAEGLRAGASRTLISIK